MVSNSEVSGGKGGRFSLGAYSQSSTLTAAPQLKPLNKNDLNNNELSGNGTQSPLRTGTAAKRLLQEQDATQVFEAGRAVLTPKQQLSRNLGATLRYLTQTEVHTYAFSVAANAILSFFPSIVLLLTLTRQVFHSTAMYDVVLRMLRDYLPSNQDFVIRNLQFLASVKGRGQILSFFMLVVTSTGVFLPLEVALNSVWGFKSNRSYLMNQIVSLGLAFGCGALALASIAVTAKNLQLLGSMIGNQNLVYRGVGFLILKAAAMIATIGIFFLIYWILPHGKVPVRAVLPAAIISGLTWEISKYIYVLLLPVLNFQEV